MRGDNLFRILTTEELLKELEKYKFKQLHTHHTWKPTHKNFNGKNHIQLQESMRNHHVNVNKWSDIGQHLTLMPDGLWVTGRPFDITPASISGWNTGALAVEMLGNFDKIGELPFNDLGYDELEGKQKESMLLLMNWFGEKFGYDNIKFHRDNPTAGKSCPGTSLNKVTMINEAKSIKKGSGVVSDKKDIIKINLHGKPLEVEGILKDQTYHVPIRFLEKLGYEVGWQDGKVTIDYKGEDK